ncbi:MAG: type II toxin-antitoxin system VapC family toxin [Verrucomicrobiota bacterium]
MTLIDTNVLVDIWSKDPLWFDWASGEFASAISRGAVVINPVIYAELSWGFQSESDLDSAIGGASLTLVDLPCGTGWSASCAFKKYRQRGGTKTSPLADFFIGAHAEAIGVPILTRDVGGYRSYFPSVQLICP